MVTTAASPTTSICLTCTDEDLFNSLVKLLTDESPQPSNVIDGVNPYLLEPQNLPPGVLFLINSKDSVESQYGIWKTKGDDCEAFSNPNFIGWKTILEYYEGQFPQERKTNWVMEVFSTTQTRLTDENVKKEANSLCRVFRVPSLETLHNVSTVGIDTETGNHLIYNALALDASSRNATGSSGNPEVNRHYEKEVPKYHREDTETSIFSRDQTDVFSGGNFLELNDLDNPPSSSSSSSENSSAGSISSDECFDAMDLLNDLDQDQVPEQNSTSKLVNAPTTNNPEEMVTSRPPLGTLVSVDGSNSGSDESFKTCDSTHISVSRSKVIGSSSSGGRKRAGFGGMGKLRKKYLCFMPF